MHLSGGPSKSGKNERGHRIYCSLQCNDGVANLNPASQKIYRYWTNLSIELFTTYRSTAQIIEYYCKERSTILGMRVSAYTHD